MPDRAPLRGLSIVAGQDATPVPEHAFRATAAARGAPTDTVFHSASARDVDAAARAAAQAFGVLRELAPERRATLLERSAERLESHSAPLIDVASEETGLAAPRIASELARTVFQLRLYAATLREGSWVEALIDHGDPARTPLPKPDLRAMLVPLGPVAVFGASNFPLAYSSAGGDTASALAAGCPVLVKGHPLHPGTGELAARAIAESVRELELPAGTLSFLHAGGGRARAVGEELVQHPAIRAAGFTGSQQGGMALARLAAARPEPIPFFGELGSVNPTFVLPAALARRGAAIAEALAASITNSAGQMCTRPGLVFVVAGEAERAFASALAAAAGRVAPQVQLSADHARSWSERVAAQRALPGVGELTGAPQPGPGSSARLLRTSFAVWRARPELGEECFGPSALLVVCDDAGQLEQAVEHLAGALAGALWSDAADAELARRLAPRLAARVGRLVHDGVTTGVEVASAMVHGGPLPSSTRPDSTAVGPRALRRWCRPVSFQNLPEALLPEELREANPRRIARLVDGRWQLPV